MSDDLSRRLAAVADTADTAGLAPTEAVRARGERRRRRQWAATGLAGALSVALVGGVAVGVLARPDGEDSLVADSTSSSSPTPSPTPTTATPTLEATATASARVSPPASPSASPSPSRPSPSPSPSSSPSASAAPREVPAATLLRPDDLSAVAANWTAREDTTSLGPSTFDPCGGTSYPTDRERLTSRSRELLQVESDGSPTPEGAQVVDTVVRYGGDAAERAMAGYSRVLAACARPAPRPGQVTGYVALVDQPDTLVVRENYDGSPWPTYTVIVRGDDLVATVGYSAGETADDAGARRLAELARTALCRDDTAGC